MRSNSEQMPISREEWESFARAEPGLVDDGDWIEWRDIGRQPVFSNTAGDGWEVSLSWREGQVSIVGAGTERACSELAQLAARLDATLVGPAPLARGGGDAT